MAKKIAIMIICVFLLVNLAGCETIQRKFTRKPKDTKPVPKFYEEEYTPEYPNSTLYNNHYMYWKAWMDELITALEGTNWKKQKQTAQYAYDELLYMNKYLVGEKQKQLQDDIKDLDRINKRLLQGDVTPGDAMLLRSQADKHLMRVRKDFSLNQVKDYIKE